jgi:hypothetical protein
MEYAIRSIAISLFVREELGIDLSQRYRIKPISKSPRRFEFTEISEEEREYYDQKTKTEPRVVNGVRLPPQSIGGKYKPRFKFQRKIHWSLGVSSQKYKVRLR